VVAGRVCRGHRPRSRFPPLLRGVQGLENCHPVWGFLLDPADAVSTVVDAAGSSVDCWLVAAAGPANG